MRPLFTQITPANLHYLDPKFCEKLGGSYRQIRADRFYCFHCVDVSSDSSGWRDSQQVKVHVESMHGFAPVPGVDFGDGTELQRMLKRWHRECAERLDRFNNFLDSLSGADDLLLDVGTVDV